MAAIPSWLATMRSITGTKEVQGGADSPVIMKWRDEIARRYPDMAPYCATYTHDSIAWCGLTVAYCMAVNGIKPVKEFLWADNWRKFGTKLDKPVLGCILTFKRTGGNHVAFYEGEDGPYYIIRGGNQSDAVTVMKKAKSECTGMMWPAQQVATAPVQPKPPVVAPVSTTTKAATAGGVVVAGGTAAAVHQGVSALTILGWIGGLSAAAIVAFIIGYRIIKGTWPWTSNGKASLELLHRLPQSSEPSLALASAQLALSSAASPVAPSRRSSASKKPRKRSAKPSQRTRKPLKSSSSLKRTGGKKSLPKRKSKSRN